MQSNDKIGFFLYEIHAHHTLSICVALRIFGVRVKIKTDKGEMYFRYKLIIHIYKCKG